MNKQELEQRIKAVEIEVAEIKKGLKQKNQNVIWEPAPNETYYIANVYGAVAECSHENPDLIHNDWITGSVYRTKCESELAYQRQKFTNLYRKYVEEHSEPLDWSGLISQQKYSAHFDHKTGEIEVWTSYLSQDAFQIYASSEQVIRDAIQFIGEENMKKYVFGVTK